MWIPRWKYIYGVPIRDLLNVWPAHFFVFDDKFLCWSLMLLHLFFFMHSYDTNTINISFFSEQIIIFLSKEMFVFEDNLNQ